MPLSKVLNKTRGANQRGTHAHYKGEFGSTREPGKQIDKSGAGRQPAKAADGSKRMSKENSKDPHYRVARAEHFANEAMKAHAAHVAAKTPEEKLKHEATIAHAAQRAGVHSRFVTKNLPGSQHADDSVRHALVAKHLHEDILSRKTEAKEQAKEKKADEKKAAEKKQRDEEKKKEREERTAHLAEMKKQKQEAKAHADEAKRQADEARRAAESVKSGAEKTQHEIESESEFRKMQDEFRQKLSPDEIKSSLRYSREYYNDINRFYRGDDRVKKLGDDESTIAKHIDSMMEKSKSTAPLVTHRAAHFDEGSEMHSLKPGDSFTDHGFTSTSYRANNIERFGNVHFVVTSPVGTKIAAIPSAAGEGELLLARGSKMTVTKREEHEGGRVTLHVSVDSQSHERTKNDAPKSTTESTKSESQATHMSEEHFDKIRDQYAKSLTPQEEKAAVNYSSFHAVTWNRALRNDEPDKLKKYEGMINDLDTAVKKHTVEHDTLAYRGIAEDPKVFAHFGSMKTGDTYVDKGYTSTSSSPFKRFSGSHSVVRVEITVPKGGHAAPIPSVKSQERELLLPRNQKYRVDRVEHINDWEGHSIKMHVTALQGE